MPEKLIQIEFQDRKLPYNTRLTLDLSMLKKVLPLIQPEILKGMVDTSGDDKVIIHLNLSEEQIQQVNALQKSTMEKKIA